ncbi:MAG: methionine adenosyltransferase [Candidatus Berkelbacteria bacterium]
MKVDFIQKTAEAVSKGHPDKICDQISDAILDECLREDKYSRVAVETMGGHGEVSIMGEVTTKADLDIDKIVENVYRSIGYTDKLKIVSHLVVQSPDIAQGVDTGGAGDQGVMVGYACKDNEQMIPHELYLARKILMDLPEEFGPDAKCQVTLKDHGKQKFEIETIVLSAQHSEGASFKKLHTLCEQYSPKKIIVNGTGNFVIGGFDGDTGLTGRKIVQDAYGPEVPVGGGAFSGKDATKVDRSAAYMARKIAKDYVKKYNADNVLVKIAYSIGVAQPVMAKAEVYSAAGLLQEINILKDFDYDLRPQAIISQLNLLAPIYLSTAEYGHFGNAEFSWEK